MKPEEQIKALAELDGLTLHTVNGVTYCWNEERNKNLPPYDDGMMMIPKYLTCYDAIIPLIQKQNDHIKIRMDEAVRTHNTVSAMINLTASQLCEALLKATERWKA
jgi:hypothetical protein